MKNNAINPPDWLSKNAVYQINPRTFSKEGTIASVKKELSYLKSLGFNVIYLCPVFTEDDSDDEKFWSARQKASGTNNPKNPYRINDYFFIDEEYGTIEDLTELVAEAHSLEMKVLLDLVYAHMGPNAPIIKRHPEFIKQNQDGSFINTQWNFPEIDFRCDGLREYLYCNMVYYISVCDVDGFRCDVGDAVPIDFWKEAKRRMHTIKPDAVLIDEGCEFKNMSIAFDSAYAFDWHNKLYQVFGENAPARELSETWKNLHDAAPENALLLRDMDNHDTVTDWPERIEKMITHDGMEQILAINYLIDGIPMVYAGNEIACSAHISMFANRFHMGSFEVTDRSLKSTPDSIRRQETIKKLNELKRESDILRFGKTAWINVFDDEKIISFKRCFNNSEIVFIGNTKNETICLDKLPENILLGNYTISDNKLMLGCCQYIVYKN